MGELQTEQDHTMADAPVPLPPADGPGPGGPAGMTPTSDQKNWAAGGHASGIVAGFLLGGLAFVGPLVVWLVKKDTDPYVAEHAREALNFQITWTIGGYVLFAVLGVLSVLTLGLGLLLFIPAGLLVGGAWLWFSVKASIAATNGQGYRYPLTVRLVN